MVVVAGQLPRDERRVTAGPEGRDERGGERQGPPRRGPDGDRPPTRLRAHAGFEAGGQVRRRQAPQPGVQRALGLGLRAAGGAGLEVRGDRRRGLGVELAVHESGDALRVAAQLVFPPRASRSRARPRWMRDITVPTGMPTVAAISA